MAMLYFKCLILFQISLFYCCLAKEEFIVSYAPPSVKFTSTEPIHSSNIADMFSATLCYTLPKQIQWSSLSPVNPFHRPKAIFLLDILGFKNDMELDIEGLHFLLENIGDIDGQYDVLAHRTFIRYSEKKPILMQIDADNDLYSPKSEYPVLLKSVPASRAEQLQLVLSDTELSQTIEDETFNISNPDDISLLREIATVKSFLSSISKHKSLIVDGVPDIYWLKLSGLQNLVKQYGSDSYQVSEGIRLLRQMITEIIPIVKSIYNDQAMLTVITENSEPTPLYKRTRNLLAVDNQAKEYGGLNLAKVWSPDFPVAFAIITFLVVTIALTILGISVAIWNMDPGRDSIMIGQRLKKD